MSFSLSQYVFLFIVLVDFSACDDQNIAYRQRETENIGSNYKITIGKKLAIGDAIEVTGVHHFQHNKSKSKFYVSIQNRKRKILVDAKWSKAKGDGQIKFHDLKGEMHNERYFFSGLQEGEHFILSIVCLDVGFAVLVNGDPFSPIIPYRIPVSEAYYIRFPKHSDIKWGTWRVSKSDVYDKYKDLEQMFAKKTTEISNSIKPADIIEYADSTRGTMALLQWKIYKNMVERCGIVDMNDKNIKWILSQKEVLEMLLTSGTNVFVKRSLEILAEILKIDPEARTGWKLRWAVAVSLSGSKGIWSYAEYRKLQIDPVKRYTAYVEWKKKGILYKPFSEGTAWHLSFVAGSIATDQEMDWVHGNIPDEKYKNPAMISKSAYKLIKYTKYNKDGTSVQNGLLYYYGKPRTLKAMHEIGAVCGGISNAASVIADAFGVPASAVGQPGHCAYVYLTNGQWTLGYSVNSWKESTIKKTDILWHQSNAGFIHVMELCQRKLPKYILSEKMRIAAETLDETQRFAVLKSAIDICPENYALWMDLKNTEVPSRSLPELEEKAELMIADVGKGLKSTALIGVQEDINSLLKSYTD